MLREVDVHLTPTKHEQGAQVNKMPVATLPTTTPNASPFLLKVQDVETLAQSDGFNILRAHLSEHYTYE